MDFWIVALLTARCLPPRHCCFSSRRFLELNLELEICLKLDVCICNSFLNGLNQIIFTVFAIGVINTMEYIVGRRVALPGSVSPYAVSLSQCGVVAAVTLQGVHLFVRYLVPLNSFFS